MNVLEAIFAWTDLRIPSSYYMLMPDGLYNDKDQRIRGSKTLAWTLLQKYAVGDTLEKREKDVKWQLFATQSPLAADHFSLKKGIFRHSTYRPFVVDLTLEAAVERIKQFRTVSQKNIYERFMEFMTLITFLESLKNSKVMLGGIWISHRTMSQGAQTHKDGYGVFVKNLADRTSVIEELNPILDDYPLWSFDEIGKVVLPHAREYVSDYAIYVENLMLRVYLKNLIQKSFLILSYANDDDKKKADTEIFAVKAILEEYRQFLAQ